MQVEDEKHISTSLNKTSSPVHSSQITLSRRGMVIVLCAVAIWSMTPVFIDQLQIVRRPGVFKLQRREIGYYVLYGVLGVSLFNLAFNTSEAINKSAVATTLMFCAPVFVALGSWWVFLERLKPTQMLAIVINLLGLFSGICFAVYTLLGRGAARSKWLSPIVILCYTYLSGTLALQEKMKSILCCFPGTMLSVVDMNVRLLKFVDKRCILRLSEENF